MPEGLDEELMARQEELERDRQDELARRQQLERQRQKLAQGARVFSKATGAARSQIKRQAVKVAARAVVTTILPVLWSVFLTALPFILIGALILLVIFMAIFIICDPSSLGVLGYVVSIGNWLSGLVPQEICDAIGGAAGAITNVVEGGLAAMCSTPEIIAQQTGALFPPEDDGDLKNLTDCVRGRVPNAGSVFTFEQDNNFCNASRGDDQYEGTCGRCAHSENSCHYGGSNGRTGSLAVDFGGNSGRGNEGVIGAQILQEVQACSQSLGIGIKRSTCEAEGATQPNGDNWVFCDDPRANHVHVSLAICDRDNGPINTR